MTFHTSLTAWPQGFSQSWRLGTCTQHPSLRRVQDEHETHLPWSWEGMQLSTACSSSSGFLRVFPGSFGGSADLNHVTMKLSTGTAMHSAASPPPFCHVNVNMNHQDRSKSIKMPGFPAPAVTFRALFKPAIFIVGTCRSLSEDPNHL